MRTLSQDQEVLAAVTSSGAFSSAVDGRVGMGAATVPLPDYVVQTLTSAGRLVGVPLAYLLPDPALLADESLQFLVVDPAWVHALQRGMLSAASPVPLSDDDLDAIIDANLPAAEPLTGLLMHSALVSDYPTLTVRPFTGVLGVDDDPDDPAFGAVPVAAVRCERLTPSTLFVLFERVPDLIVIDEPHGMTRLGVALSSAGPPVARLRTVAGILVEQGGNPVEVQVPFRGDPAAGVVDITGLAAALRTGVASTPAATRAPDPVASPAGLAIQLLVAPARQRYQRGVTT